MKDDFKKNNHKTDFVNINMRFSRTDTQVDTQTDTKTEKAFNKATKIGVYKELHKKGLLDDCELATLISRQDKIAD